MWNKPLNRFYLKATHARRSYGYLLLFSLSNLLIQLVSIPLRILDLIKHLIFCNYRSPVNEKWWFWPIILIFKIIDITCVFHLIHLLLIAVKPFSVRLLTSREVKESMNVFNHNYPYWKISIDERSFFAHLGAKYNGTKNLGVVIFNSINFTRKIKTKESSYDIGWLIHEITHTNQFDAVGSSYIFYNLYAQNTSGYSLPSILPKKLNALNFEQQAEVFRLAYQKKYHLLF